MNYIRRILADEKGVTAIEYSLIGGLIAVVIIGMVTLVGQDVNYVFDRIASALPSATN